MSVLQSIRSALVPIRREGAPFIAAAIGVAVSCARCNGEAKTAVMS